MQISQEPSWYGTPFPRMKDLYPDQMMPSANGRHVSSFGRRGRRGRGKKLANALDDPAQLDAAYQHVGPNGSPGLIST